MLRLRHKLRAVAAFAWGVFFASGSVSAAAPPAADPLAEEIARWSAYVKDSKRTDEMWTQLKGGIVPLLTRSEEAFKAGRRELALHRLAYAMTSLSAARWADDRPEADGNDIQKFETEWASSGKALAADMRALSPSSFDGITPALTRAIAEAAAPQVKVYYDASLEYGRNTMAGSGFYYVGLARAERDLIAFCRRLSSQTAAPARRLPARSLDAELESLETEFLAAYRPPASIDKHSDFISSAAALKEARELNAAGLHYGALLRYLQSVQRLSTLRGTAPALDPEALAAKLKESAARVAAAGFDPSLARLFLETAESEGAGPIASAIVADVLPRYFAALEPARALPPKPAPRATVTLVRWPYT